MSPRVTAILVVRDGSESLARTLDALSTQTRPADGIIAVASRSSEATIAELTRVPGVKLVTSSEDLSFGQAVAAGVRVTEQPEDAEQMLWLLSEDSAPEPTALAALLGALEVSPSVGVAGPKILDWDDASFLRRYGETITTLGAAVPVVEDELDQAQHDTMNDVMAVGPAGMLVRHQLWDQLGGFDAALVADDALDFCIRTRLAGYLVAVVPTARVASAGSGIAGPSWSNKIGARRRRHRQARAAQLHRRLVYAPAIMVPVHWLSLVPLAIMRVIGYFVKKQPELVLGELSAAFAVAFSGIKVSSARRQLAKNRTLGWSSIAGLRMKLDEVRRQRALAREATQIGFIGEERDLRFFSGGGAWVVLATAVIGAAILAPLLGASYIQGGALLPLSGSVPELWQQAGFGWRDVGLGFVGAADPFSAVLAVLGSITFWEPSFSLVLLFLLALPLSALGAWFASTRLTERAGVRAVAAILWALAPTLLTALADGRPAAVIVHILLPWLFYAGVVAARSWAAAGTSALLLTATVACSPSLAPALVVIWVIAIAFAGRGVARVVLVPIPAFALFAPLIWQQGIHRGNWLGLLADPGAVTPATAASGWQLSLGFPGGSLGGWSQIAATLGLPGMAPVFVVPALLAPLAIVAFLALFLPGSRRAIPLLVAAFLGLVSAVLASHLLLASTGGEAAPVWAGAAISLYWLGIIGAVTLGLDRIKRFSAIPALVIVLAAAVIVVPLALAQPLGTSVVRESSGRQLPAYVTAATQTDPRLGTLVITPGADGSITAEVIRGQGMTLDGQSTIVQTAPGISADDRTVAELAGNLASQSGLDPTDTLVENGIAFVLLSPTVEGSEQTVAGQTAGRAASALDANAALVAVGDTTSGTLWRAVADVGSGPAVPKMNVVGTLVGVGLAIVFLITLLLSIPNGASRDGYRAGSRKPPKLKGRAARQAAAAAAGTAVVQTDDDAVGSYDDEDASGDIDEETGEIEPDAAGSADSASPRRPQWWRRGRKDGAPTAGAAALPAEQVVSDQPVDDAAQPAESALDGSGTDAAAVSDPDVEGVGAAVSVAPEPTDATAVRAEQTDAEQPDPRTDGLQPTETTEAESKDGPAETPRRDTPGTEQPHAE
ncbi:MAG TPA: glycosyltransferase [Plantibacter sp.]|uniref:glycosyltransferase n=1 Tax=unclassified Plantibacter TaxID=2624265 RepID=UPI002C78592F|nr:glycosyltransferase [Plantibacter sp.]